MPDTFILQGEPCQKLVEGHTTAKLPNGISFPFPSSETDNRLGTSLLCQNVTRKPGAVARVGNRGISGAQQTKNSSRHTSDDGSSSKSTQLCLKFCCNPENNPVLLQVVASAVLSESLRVTQERHPVNSCPRKFLVHLWPLGTVEGNTQLCQNIAAVHTILPHL